MDTTGLQGSDMRGKVYFHPVIIRITHWVNVAALTLMVTSGLKIYNASPIFGDWRLPTFFTFGGLAYARQYHFFAMWVFFANALVWLVYNLATRHGRQTTLFTRQDVKGVVPMVKYYLRLTKQHPYVTKYNSLQKLAYTSVIVLGAGAILSGVSIYWPVQAAPIRWLFGGYDTARVIHFLCMAALVLFFVGHLVMVIIAGWSNFFSMITGYGKPGPQAPVISE